MPSNSHPGPEFALLLTCARSGEQDPVQLRALAAQVADWEQLLQQAERHGLRPLLCRSLQGCPEAVPAPVLERLLSDVQTNARRSLQLTGELVRVLAVLGERGVRSIPYKGPVLASQLYGNLALREFVDLDILVSPEQVRDGRDALLAAGYQPSLPLAPRQEAALLRSNCEFMFQNPERQSAVELHWRIAPVHFAVEFDFKGLWARRRTLSLGGSEVSTLADQDLLLVLSAHAAKHLWACLCWTCDIAELVRARPQMDWDQAVARAQKLGVLRFLLVSLQLSRELLGTSLPEMVSAAIAGDPKAGALASAALERMWAGGSSEVSLRDHWLLLEGRERWRDKTRYAGRLLFTPGVSEWELLELPAALWPLYPAIRLGRVAGKLVRGLWPRSAASAAPLNQSPPPRRS